MLHAVHQHLFQGGGILRDPGDYGADGPLVEEPERQELDMAEQLDAEVVGQACAQADQQAGPYNADDVSRRLGEQQSQDEPAQQGQSFRRGGGDAGRDQDPVHQGAGQVRGHQVYGEAGKHECPDEAPGLPLGFQVGDQPAQDLSLVQADGANRGGFRQEQAAGGATFVFAGLLGEDGRGAGRFTPGRCGPVADAVRQVSGQLAENRALGIPVADDLEGATGRGGDPGAAADQGFAGQPGDVGEGQDQSRAGGGFREDAQGLVGQHDPFNAERAVDPDIGGDRCFEGFAGGEGLPDAGVEVGRQGFHVGRHARHFTR